MTINFYKTATLLVFSFFILSGCQLFQGVQQVSENVSGKVQFEQKKLAEKNLAKIKCQELCQIELAAGDKDFLSGPCLAEEIIPDWSCDIAHEPRQEADDEHENQCASFRNGLTHHFVEVDGNCNTLQVY